MLTHGIPLKVVSDILGHSSIAITGDVFGHVATDVSRGAMDVLGAAFGSEGDLIVVKMAVKVPQEAVRSRSGSLRKRALTSDFALSG